MKTTKVRRIVIVIVISVFTVFHAMWVLNYFAYQNYSYGDGYVEAVGNLVKASEDNAYTFSIVRPAYPSFTGNFALNNNIDDISVIIWPGLFADSNIEYGLRMYDAELDFTFGFYVDKNFHYIEEKNDALSYKKEDILELLSTYENELSEMKHMTEEEWEL